MASDYEDLAKEINQIQLDLAKGLSSLQLLAERDAADLVDVRRHTEEIRLGMHSLSLEFTRKLEHLATRLAQVEKDGEKDTSRDDTQKQQLRLERFDQRIEIVERWQSDKEAAEKEAIDKREKGHLHLAAEDKKGRWAFKAALGTAVVSAIVALGSVVIPLLWERFFGG